MLKTVVDSHQKSQNKSLVLPLQEVGIADISLVGGKNASLGKMIQRLRPQGVRVPVGFATTAFAYRYFIQVSGLETPKGNIFASLDVENLDRDFDGSIVSYSRRR